MLFADARHQTTVATRDENAYILMGASLIHVYSFDPGSQHGNASASPSTIIAAGCLPTRPTCG